MSEEGAPKRRLVAIDALRGIAVLAVFVSHLPFSMATTPAGPHAPSAGSVFPAWLVACLDHGRFGVHLFLVISGFCIHMAWARRRSDTAPVSFAAFWKRRLHRLYPPYFVALLLSLAGLYVLHGVLGGASGSLAVRLGYASSTQLAIDIVLLLMLAQNLNGASHRIGNGPFWTLALEEQLYALYFPLLFMRKRFGWTTAIVVVLGTTLAWRTTATLTMPGQLQDTLFVVGPSRWFEWTLGALAVEAYLGRVTLPAWCQSGVAGVGIVAVAVAAFDGPRFGAPLALVIPFCDALFGLGLFVLVNHACHVRWGEDVRATVVSRFFAWVGTFSYSLYLTHQLVIVAAKQVALRLGLGVPGVLLLRLVLPVAAAWVFFQLIERRFLNSSRPAATSAAVGSLEGNAGL
jgi:peptidoglycan/LPS O-acetylase OafA/YrhL